MTPPGFNKVIVLWGAAQKRGLRPLKILHTWQCVFGVSFCSSEGLDPLVLCTWTAEKKSSFVSDTRAVQKPEFKEDTHQMSVMVALCSSGTSRGPLALLLALAGGWALTPGDGMGLEKLGEETAGARGCCCCCDSYLCRTLCLSRSPSPRLRYEMPVTQHVR